MDRLKELLTVEYIDRILVDLGKQLRPRCRESHKYDEKETGVMFMQYDALLMLKISLFEDPKTIDKDRLINILDMRRSFECLVSK